jgi:hypothetical protein
MLYNRTHSETINNAYCMMDAVGDGQHDDTTDVFSI